MKILTIRITWDHEYNLTDDGIKQTLKSQYPDFNFKVENEPCREIAINTLWIYVNETDLNYTIQKKAIRRIIEKKWLDANRILPDFVFELEFEALKKYGGGLLNCSYLEYMDAINTETDILLQDVKQYG